MDAEAAELAALDAEIQLLLSPRSSISKIVDRAAYHRDFIERKTLDDPTYIHRRRAQARAWSHRNNPDREPRPEHWKENKAAQEEVSRETNTNTSPKEI